MRRLIFFFILVVFSSMVFAEVCCERDVNGNYCMFVDSGLCAADYLKASVGCEQTSFCKSGCCYNSKDGTCFTSVGKAQCKAEGGVWDENADCDIDQCKKGCCIIGAESFFVTEVQCKSETSKYPDVEMIFREDVTSERDCANVARNQEEGCCVMDDGCKFVTRGECNIEINNETGTGFFKDMLCSNDELGCDCARQHHTSCVADRDEVYWFDSCGNMENIYSTDKSYSYNDGYVLSRKDSCTLNGPEDITCGNCNYNTGTVCGTNVNEVLEDDLFGEHICRDVNCHNIYSDFVSPNAGGDKKNGESWCIYDSVVGHGRDVVGSRHYRHLCINGEEMIESCRDFRDEICIQGVLGNDPTGTYDAFGVKGDYVEAACRKSRWEDCIGIADEDDCEKVAYRDCYWAGFGIGEESGVCIPEVPPGLKFWTDDRVDVIESSSRVTGEAVTTRGTAALGGGGYSVGRGGDVCEAGSFECTAVFKRGGVGRLTGEGDWECMHNCHCTEKDWIVAANNFCKSLGDCGAYYNILGKSTTDGFSSTCSNQKFGDCYSLTQADLDNWNALSRPGDGKYDSPGFFSEMTRGGKGFALGTIIATGLWGGYQNQWVEGSIMGGAFAGLKGAGSLIFGGLDKLVGSTAGERVGWREFIRSSYGGISEGQSLKGSIISEGMFQKATEDSFSQAGNYYFKNSAVASQWLEKETLKGITLEGEAAKKFLSENIVAEITDDGAVRIVKDVKATKSIGAGGSTAIGVINTIMWIYTIYNIVDVMFAETEDVTYTVGCGLWQAPSGGQDCEKCNEGDKPCSLYRCKSLGQLCSLVNPDTSDEKCVNIHPNDVNSPIISADPEVLTNKYSLRETLFEGNKGFEINEKLEPFSMISFGIKTDEIAQCKFSKEPGKKYEEMEFMFGDGIYRYEHSISFSFPTELTSREALELTNGGEYMLYLRCRDASGNTNNRDYFIKFNIKPSPDLTAPVIEDTSIENGGYLAHGVNETELTLFLNEPAQCKWDRNDKDYGFMVYDMVCDQDGFRRANEYYQCKTTLTDIMDENIFYFRCKDLKGNTNVESYEYKLYGTDALYILSSGPSGIFYVSDVALKVMTSGGAESGNAKCGYLEEDTAYENMIEFFETDSAFHEQPFTLVKGDYNYYVKCRDVAGNEDSDTISFKIDVDYSPPQIVYVYKEEDSLHLEMDEISSCRYSINSTFFMYDDGIAMTGDGSFEHELQSTEKMFSVICVDEYYNEGSYKIYV